MQFEYIISESIFNKLNRPTLECINTLLNEMKEANFEIVLHSKQFQCTQYITETVMNVQLSRWININSQLDVKSFKKEKCKLIRATDWSWGAISATRFKWFLNSFFHSKSINSGDYLISEDLPLVHKFALRIHNKCCRQF